MLDVQRDEKIKAELLAYEKSKSSFVQPPQDESSNSDNDDDNGMDCNSRGYSFTRHALNKISTQ